MYLSRYFTPSVKPNHLTFQNFSDAVIETLDEFQKHSCLLFNEDYEFISVSKNSDGSTPDALSICSSDLEFYELSPMLTSNGLKRVRNSDHNLDVTLHTTFGGNKHFCFKNQSFHLLGPATLNQMHGEGVVFQATYNNRNIYGTVTRDECCQLLPKGFHDNKNVILSIMYETAMYRAFQRMDYRLLSKEIQSFITLHELRNFLTFHNHNYDTDIFSQICSTIDGRSDYLQTLSKAWKENYQAEKSFFALGLTKLVIEHNLTAQQATNYAYSLSEEAAFSNHSLSPIRGGIYIGISESEQGLTPYIGETVNGKVARCFATAGLLDVFAENVYENDECLMDETINFSSQNFTEQTRKQSQYVGVFAELTFVDKSKHSVFIGKDEIYELASNANSDTWQGVFFERMSIKTAIKQAIDGCNWSNKYCNNSSRYC